jgi:hypothetical protein
VPVSVFVLFGTEVDNLRDEDEIRVGDRALDALGLVDEGLSVCLSRNDEAHAEANDVQPRGSHVWRLKHAADA